jgi:hypothetical protein
MLSGRPVTYLSLYHKKGDTKCIFYLSDCGLTDNEFAIAVSFPKGMALPYLEFLQGTTGDVVSTVSISSTNIEKILSGVTVAAVL